jgi:serine/threonine protein kinase
MAVGAGGFGTIYAARTGDGRVLAVKVLEMQDVRRELQRFQQEFHKLQSAAEHPGIVQCYDFDVAMIEGREYPWYSMEFALGDLSVRIDRRRESDPDRPPWDYPAHRASIVKEFRAVTDAVGHLHRLNIVHRDLKPGNILLMEDGSLKLSDFGLVKSLASSGQGLGSRSSATAGTAKGTHTYMAPEQERGERVGKTADVYSLGVLLAELTTGEHPRPRTQVKRGSTLQYWGPLRQLPEPLQEFLTKCTDVNPSERPADARGVLTEFDAAVHGSAQPNRG